MVRLAPGERSVETTGPVARGDTRLLDSVCDAMQVDASRIGAVALDTSAFGTPDGSAKYGFGSSAALTVALVGALAAWFGAESGGEMPYMAHERFQSTPGSGVDIATSLAGGLIEYRFGGRTVTALDWPDDLHLALVFSGISASTGSMLAKLDPASVDYSELGRAAENAAAAWSTGDAAKIVAATLDYGAALGKFDEQNRIGIFDGGHAALVNAARHSAVAYKPCGAGGGDIGVVLGTSVAEVDAFVAAAAGQGFSRVDASIDMNGMAVSGARA